MSDSALPQGTLYDTITLHKRILDPLKELTCFKAQNRDRKQLLRDGNFSNKVVSKKSRLNT